ncbi:MAG: hypothetical protein DSM106950_17570 [Stigonema ocellatum SAG 48.90 = DSM 106950]|nr:hypothetical protein [Stigonema ocellatum SAG 48.90 = DSM 106950]
MIDELKMKEKQMPMIEAGEAKTPVREKQLAVRVTPSEFDAFKDKAKMEGKSPSQVLLEFVLNYINQPTNLGVEARVRSLEEKMQEIQQQMGKLVA